ncbi:MAG: S-methyl-5-thioribose-1-phosphate isomerase [Thermoflexales bacterium]|nr:S-methyl-5-thioribose-1-phosphate isomerase [Thermoflexales bacterium]MDW8373905.1 S-methyl-5-thioribose-1-phosphate isomerase [Planctomycetota bacterium]
MIPVKTIEWIGGLDGVARLIDQTLLPGELRYLDVRDVETMWEAIRMLRVRGAPAIGIAAAMGMVLAVRDCAPDRRDAFLAAVERAAAYLNSARPTAVNLSWATRRMQSLVIRHPDLSVEALKWRMLDEAKAMVDEDNAVCQAIGRLGEPLIRDGDSWLTHCNAGGLATAQWGTATAPIYMAHAAGKRIHVFADETRPLLQGARLTAWELQQVGVPVTVITDNMAATVMAQGKVQGVIVGTDRMAANGDFANKIGTLGVAVLAKEFGVPFYVAAPTSSIDMRLASGEAIPIEERRPEEVSEGFGRRTVPPGVRIYNPAFDVTPHRYVTAIITERGIVHPPFHEGLRALFERLPSSQP